MLSDDFLPVYDISDEVATVVSADQKATWNALMNADLIDVGRKRPLVAMLGAARMLPDRPGKPGQGERCSWSSHYSLPFRD